MKTTYLAVDVGGTQLRAAAYLEGETTPAIIKRIPTRSRGGASGSSRGSTAVERLQGLIAEVLEAASAARGKVQSIAVAVPGPTDPEAGVIYTAPNIPGWDNLPLKHLLEERFHLPVALGNDANLAALGEWKFGAGRGARNMLFMTISTGIGAGVIMDGRLLLGAHGLATELGHMVILPDGPLCSCGKRGHLEALASGTAIARYVTEQIQQGAVSSLTAIEKISAKEISQAAAQGDALALAALEQAGRYLGLALGNYLHAFNPSVIVLGGGVTRSGAPLLKPLQATLEEQVMTPVYLQDLEITTAALGDDAGLMGALALAQATGG